MMKREWKVSEKRLLWRTGMKAGWFEIRLVDPEGNEVKMIARKVNRFWSEQDDREEGL